LLQPIRLFKDLKSSFFRNKFSHPRANKQQYAKQMDELTGVSGVDDRQTKLLADLMEFINDNCPVNHKLYPIRT